MRKLAVFFCVVFCQLSLSVRAADIVWTNTAGGNWSAITNWSPNQVPVATDNAIITNNGTYTVTLNVAATNATLTLGGASGTQTMIINQALTLNGASTVGTNGVLNKPSATLTGTGGLTVNGQFNWGGGVISGTGLMTIGTNGTLLMTNNSSFQMVTKTIVNQGSASLWTGTLLVQTGSVFSNATSGTFDLAFDGGFSGTATEQFVNAGLFRKSGGTNSGGTSINPQFSNSGTLQVQSGTMDLRTAVTNTGTISVSAGATVTLSAAKTLMAGNTVLNGGGTILAQGGGAVTFTNGYTVTNVILNISGNPVSFNTDGTIWPSALNLSNGSLGGIGKLTVNAPINWTGGNISASNTVTATGGMLLAGTGHFALQNGTLINTGSAFYTNGIFDLQSGATFSNAPSGTFEFDFDGNINGNTTTLFANAGTMRKSVGTNISAISGVFANSSVVQVQAATLSLTASGTNTGSFSVSSNATLNLGPISGTLLMADGSTVSGAGNFSVGNGTVNLNGTLGVGGSSSFTGGIANFNGSYNITGGTTTIVNGTANFNGAGTISPTTLNLSGGTLGGTNDVTVNGLIYWTGTTITGSGAITANGGLILGGSGHMQLQTRSLINTAAAAYTNGIFDLQFGASFSNAPGGTFDITFDGGITGGASTPMANAGLFRKTGGTGTSTISPVFNNSGTNDVQTGTMTLNTGGTNTGIFTVEAGATFNLGGGTHYFNASSSITGAGTFSISSATANLAGALNVTGTNTFASGSTANFSGSYTIAGGTLNIFGGTANFNGIGVITPAILNLSNGTLGGTNDVTVSAPMNWASGIISGSGVVSAAGGLYLTNNGLRYLTGRSLINTGQALWSLGLLNTGSGSVISNATGATFDLGADVGTGSVSGNRAIYNAGLWRKIGGTNASTFSDNFTNTGTVEVQTGTMTFTGPAIQNAGLTLLDGGNLSVSTPLQIRGGTLAGNGSILGTVTNNGSVSPSGALIISVNYIQTTNGALNIAIGGTNAGTDFGRLLVTNTVTLAGALNVTLTNGFYPATNAVFTYLTNGSRTGTFTNFYFPSNNVGMTTNYTTTNASIQVINVHPVIPAMANQTNDELVLFSLAVNATDDDAGQTLSYALANSPTNASVNSSGVITWTPTEAQGPMTTNITVLVTDNGTPNLTVSRTFQIVVNEINVAPQLNVPGTQTVTESNTLNVSVSATDSDIPTNSLVFSLVSPPTGMTINTNTGAIAWTPDESQGSNSYTIKVVVTDLNTNAVNTQQLSATNSFTVIVNESNSPPVLTVPGNQIITESNILSVSASATDPDLPANPLTFSLSSPPTGMTINSNTGAILWTPDESQGSNTYAIKVVVTDLNTNAINAHQISVTNSFNVIVNESNSPPVLTVPADQTINELVLYTNNATATDPDLPANTLTFALVSGPTNMIVSSAGAISWTPNEAQGPSTNLIKISVTDTNPLAINAKSLSVTNSFTLTVSEVNVAPVLTLPPNTNINEMVPWTATSTATDSDLPTNALTFALVSGPTNLTVSTAGVINWTPSEAQGPGTYPVTISVTDSNLFAVNATSLSVTNTFQISVAEVNLPPVLTLPTNQTMVELTLYTNTATATDPDVPTNTLTFALVSGPTNLIVSSAGAISWTPNEAQGPSTNPIQIKVTDNGTPPISVTNSFTITVTESNSPPVFTGPGTQTIHASGALSVNATATDPDLPTNTLTFALISGPSGLTVNSAGHVAWTTSDTNASSINPVTVKVTDNGTPSLSATNTFNVIVAARPTLLPPVFVGPNANLNWSAISGTSYRLEFTTNKFGTNWSAVSGDVIAPGTNASKQDPRTATNRTYRIRVLP